MSNKKFVALMTEYCRRNKLASPEKLMQGQPLMFGKTLISLSHDDTGIPELAYAYCDLGMPAPGRRLDVMVRLLQVNRDLHFASGQSLMMSPNTGKILVAQAIELVRVDAEMLESILLGLADTAQMWRANEFANMFDAAFDDADVSTQRRSGAERNRFMQIQHAVGAGN